MDAEKIAQIVEALEQRYARHSAEYQRILDHLCKTINDLPRGSLQNIDIEEIKDQVGHLLFYDTKQFPEKLPMDVGVVGRLLSHFKNPTILVLRRNSRYLMASHRKTLAKLTEDQARERAISFRELNPDADVAKALGQIQQLQNLAQKQRSLPKKLDVLTRALHVPANLKTHFRLVAGIVNDAYHLRNRNALLWLQNPPYNGRIPLLNQTLSKHREQLRRACVAILEEMKKVSGIPFDTDTERLDTNVSWYGLGTTLPRGEDFLNTFGREERVDRDIKKRSFPLIRTVYDAGNFEGRVEDCIPVHISPQQQVSKLASIYLELDHCIRESSRDNGEPFDAVDADETVNALSAKDAAGARDWIRANKSRLLDLQIRVLDHLRNARKAYPEVGIPPSIEEMLSEQAEGPEGMVTTSPKKVLLEVDREMSSLEESPSSDGNLLKSYVALRKQIIDQREGINHVGYQRRLRAGCKDFEAFEEKLMDFNQSLEMLAQKQESCETHIIALFRAGLVACEFEGSENLPLEIRAQFDWVDKETYDQAFAVLIDHMLLDLRNLRYDSVDADNYQIQFENALALGSQESLFMLDRLLQEVHAVPRQDQLLNALTAWENSLDRKTLSEKQDFIVFNHEKLQTLVNDIRDELRTRLETVKIRPPRLRFEVFGLSDAFAGNLKDLMTGLLRMGPRVASDEEGQRLVEHIQTIEAQVIEAQRACKGDGRAYEKLKELEKSNLLSSTLVRELHGDLDQNFKNLNELLKEINTGLGYVRGLQNNLGGDHDTDHLSITINVDDLETLRSTYDFLENITLTDLKRFALVYKHKETLMNDLFERAQKEDESLPPGIVKKMKGKAYKQFIKNHYISLELKIDILLEVPEILESESQLLIHTLNFVNSDSVHKKTVYRALIEILKTTKNAGFERKRELRRLWLKFRNRLQTYQPQNYKRNYQNNMRRLMMDKDSTVGAGFDIL